VVPERVGDITPDQIAAEAADWLAQPERLEEVRQNLQQLRGAPGAVEAVARMISRLALVPSTLLDSSKETMPVVLPVATDSPLMQSPERKRQGSPSVHREQA